ncbi:hypothetical protein BDY19DRAFT_998423 [Irpex rosettiformis]|uniref:Uncharacterized protein n=1 Tax=Irpex rosettiformis TaxID=378272 RepID=A0ACB8TNR6_9APHY|nr:hypothetical protein BDY19DRAFT_998423 [Irpex rosettiformis]
MSGSSQDNSARVTELQQSITVMQVVVATTDKVSLHSSSNCTDACVFPVLNAVEAAQLASAGEVAPPPHPQLLRTPARSLPAYQPEQGLLQPGQHTVEVLADFGVSEERIKELATKGALGRPPQQSASGLRPKL